MAALLNLISRKVIIFWKIPILTNCRFRLNRKKKEYISQMRLRSVFKMQMRILNTATTEQMGYGILSFFVYMKSTNQDLKFSSFYHNTDSDCKYYQWNHKYCHNQCCFLVKCRYDCILCF